MIVLKVRPRWKRVLYVPRTLWLYHRAGLGWWMSLKLTWDAVTFTGAWITEKGGNQ